MKTSILILGPGDLRARYQLRNAIEKVIGHDQNKVTFWSIRTRHFKAHARAAANAADRVEFVENGIHAVIK